MATQKKVPRPPPSKAVKHPSPRKRNNAPPTQRSSAHSILSIGYPDGKMVLELLRESAG